MSEPFVGEIRMFAGNFAPRGWALCDGQLLAVSQNDALFSLLGTTYGGDGRTTFALPNLRGRVPVHKGQGSGLSNYALGARGGAESVTLTANQLPSHNHTLQAASDSPVDKKAQNSLLGCSTTITPYTGNAPDGALAQAALSDAGGSQSHDNLMPFVCVNFIIALVGIYPSRQ